MEYTVNQKLAKAKIELMQFAPFLANLALKMPIVANDTIDSDGEFVCQTMRTDGRVIEYNSQFVNERSIADCIFILGHEGCHKALRHIDRTEELFHKHPIINKFGKHSRDVYFELKNIADDYAVNAILKKVKGLVIPDDGLYDKKYENKSSEAIFEELLNDLIKETEDPKGNGQDQDQDQDQKQSQNDQGESDADERGERALDKIFTDYPDFGMGQVMITDENKGDNSLDTEIEIKQSIQEVSRQGKNDSFVNRFIKQDDEVKNAPDWRSIIDHTVKSSSGKADYATSRPNILGLQRNIIISSVVNIGVSNIVFAIDMSASMNEDKLKLVLGHIKSLKDEIDPEKITILFCNTKVVSEHEFMRGEEIDIKIPKGTGGTRLSCAFNHVSLNDIECDSLIFYSDMVFSFKHMSVSMGGEPEYSVLWLSSNKDYEAPLWGESTYVE